MRPHEINETIANFIDKRKDLLKETHKKNGKIDSLTTTQVMCYLDVVLEDFENFIILRRGSYRN